MAITQAMCTSFKVLQLTGGTNAIDFSAGTTQTFKIALYTSTATLSAATTAYTTSNEVANGNGYTTGGKLVTVSQVPTSTGTTAYMNFADVTWSVTSITARGALIYRVGGANDAIAVMVFGEDKQTNGADFVVRFPTDDQNNAILRFS